VGEVITKLVEDAYFIRVDNRVTQVPPVRTHEPRHHEATNRSPIEEDVTTPLENNHQTSTALGPQLEDPPRVATARPASAVAAAALVAVMAAVGEAAARAHHLALAEEPVAVAIVGAEATRTAMSQ
jgi:hypothetical protein